MAKHGAVGWFEIGTPDVAATQQFYTAMFGWSYEDDPDNEVMPYQVVTTGEGHPIKGGVFDTGANIPNYAVPCVVVDDTAAAAAKAEGLGGKVLVPVQSAPSGLTFAHLLDPQGNHIGIYTPPAGEDV